MIFPRLAGRVLQHGCEARQDGKYTNPAIAAHAVRRVVYLPNYPFILSSAAQRDTPYVQRANTHHLGRFLVSSDLADDVWKFYSHVHDTPTRVRYTNLALHAFPRQ